MVHRCVDEAKMRPGNDLGCSAQGHVEVLDRRRWIITHRFLLGMCLIAVAAALICIWLLGARPPVWYPPCPFHALTGLQCPGCGSSRTVHALIHGDWARALAMNPLLVVLAPFALLWATWCFWRALRHDLPPPELPRPAAAITLVVVLAFWLLRNLPWWPCTLLAPHG